MRIVVCIKPIKSELVYPNDNLSESFVMNPYDLYAFQKCIELKKETQCTIICICMGSMKSESLMTKALAMGADEAILLNDQAFVGSDTIATSYVLSKAIKKISNVDVVVFGERSIDGETGQVGFGVGERLKYFCLNKIEKFECLEDKHVVVTRNDGENMEKIRIKMPCTLAFNDFIISQPDIGLIALKKARRRKITIWNAAEIQADIFKCGNKGSKTKVLNIKNSFTKKKNKIIDGTIAKKTRLILDVIQGKKS